MNQRLVNQRTTPGKAARTPSSAPATTNPATIHQPYPCPDPWRSYELPHASRTANVSSRSFSGLPGGVDFGWDICGCRSVGLLSDVSAHLSYLIQNGVAA